MLTSTNVMLQAVICFCYICLISGNNDGSIYTLISPDHHEMTPRLEDFFWTGSGDGPPPPTELDPSPPQPSVVTTTVLATVYLDNYPPQSVTDKNTGECVINCGDIASPDSLGPDIPDDRRYWLLTVIQGTTPDSLQLRLARLYQKAFLRQQEKHLGIIKSLDAPTSRKKHEVHSFIVNKDIKIEPSNIEVPLQINHNSAVPSYNISSKIDNTVLNNATDENQDQMYAANIEMYPIENDTIDIKPTKVIDADWILATPSLQKREIAYEPENEISQKLIDIPFETEVGNETVLFKREIIKPEQQPPVYVHIQNITESPDTGTVQIVYVVLVGGRAVPAAVAARDMRLVRDAEVATELGAVVTTKAEPYLKAAEGLDSSWSPPVGLQGSELWATAVGVAAALIILILLIVLLCRLIRRKKAMSAASLRAYRNEMMRAAARTQMKQVHEEKDGRLISVVSPSRTRPSSTLLPVYRAASATSSSSSSIVSEAGAAIRRRQKKHALRITHRKRAVGTTDSLLEAAGVDSSDSAKDPTAPNTPTSYLSMPSVRSFPRGNIVEPLSKVLEPISVRHLDLDSDDSPKDRRNEDLVPRRQMASQLVRLGSMDKDPGVIGPLVWDLHCQRIKDVPSPPSSRMRARFSSLVDDARALFGTPTRGGAGEGVTAIPQARNENVRLPSTHTLRGYSARVRSPPRVLPPAPARAWDAPPSLSSRNSSLPLPVVSPSYVQAAGRLAPTDPALPLISAIKTEIQRVRDNATKTMYQ